MLSMMNVVYAGLQEIPTFCDLWWVAMAVLHWGLLKKIASTKLKQTEISQHTQILQECDKELAHY